MIKLMGQSVNVTETLVTKVILGTIGCVPANDRFFQNGLKMQTMTQSFGEEA
ncbi:hypothetical protein [Paenibacillus pectinilyticus]|uniref:hypothetical protein n=1 Tax=Paenibacillus pectinilyticus TaxID=512399 RepID=UPI001428BB3F|nr:hypothetical protein [Paenibacillus pectinilyticus]